jgi:hypothetical protein
MNLYRAQVKTSGYWYALGAAPMPRTEAIVWAREFRVRSRGLDRVRLIRTRTDRGEVVLLEAARTVRREQRRQR